MEEIVSSFKSPGLLPCADLEAENQMLKKKVEDLHDQMQIYVTELGRRNKEIERLKDAHKSQIHEKELELLDLDSKYAELHDKLARQNTILAGNNMDINNSTFLEDMRKALMDEFEFSKNFELMIAKRDLLVLEKEVANYKQMLANEELRQVDLNTEYEEQLKKQEEIIIKLQNELEKKAKT